MSDISTALQQVNQTLKKLGLTVRPFDIEHASNDDWVGLQALRNRRRAEFFPDDSPFPLEHLQRSLRSIPDFVDYDMWLVWRPVYESEPEAMASINTQVVHSESNQQLMDFDIYVVDEWRRKGIASALLALVLAQAAGHERDSSTVEAYEHVPAGAAFLERLGAKRGLTLRTSQVATADIDRDLMKTWQDGIDGDGLEFGVWDGAYPEEQLEAIARLKETMNTQPREGLDVEDEKMTPTMLRQIDEMLAKRGTKRWTTWVRDAESGDYAGYSEVYWQPGEPYLAHQGDTAVVPGYRRRGLGRWLKAKMIEQILADKPEVEFIRTGNAQSNEGMLKINHEMGFRDYKVEVVWQLPLSKMEAYLAGTE